MPRGYYIGWHPRIIQGCPEYPGICGYSAKRVLYRLASTDNPGMFRVQGIRGYTAKGVLYRLASTDNPGMSRVSREFVETI